MSLIAPPYGPRPRPEVLAFLAEIKDRPEDDAPRLLLADWLRNMAIRAANCIRLQVTRAGWPCETHGKSRSIGASRNCSVSTATPGSGRC